MNHFISNLIIAYLCYTSAHQIPRTEDGRISRSKAATRKFKQQTGYPKGRPGFVIDHIIPLCAGGADSPANMTWEEITEAKKKDVEEKRLCDAITHNHFKTGIDMAGLCQAPESSQWPLLKKALCDDNKHVDGNN